ncbi:hypothetical protein PGB90_002502 [Kerria lacca]
MSDDEDYMSDKFLTGCVENDIRPGLLSTYSEKRNFQTLKRKREQDELNKKKNPNIKLMESEKRKEGLEKPIEQNNKGFALLQKMGYKPGSSIGKRETGRKEPIPIELKTDREGLGRSQMKKEIYEKRKQEISKNSISTNEFRFRLTEKIIQKQIEGDFRKSQKICERLDTDCGIFEPNENWYWLSTDPDNEKQKSNELKEDIKRRRKHYESDLSEFYDEYNDRDSTIEINEEINYESESSDDEKMQKIQSSLNINEKLDHITTYLRSAYFYCIWCCIKYNDKKELMQECPGTSREDH